MVPLELMTVRLEFVGCDRALGVFVDHVSILVIASKFLAVSEMYHTKKGKPPLTWLGGQAQETHKLDSPTLALPKLEKEWCLQEPTAPDSTCQRALWFPVPRR